MQNSARNRYEQFWHDNLNVLHHAHAGPQDSTGLIQRIEDLKAKIREDPSTWEDTVVSLELLVHAMSLQSQSGARTVSDSSQAYLWKAIQDLFATGNPTNQYISGYLFTRKYEESHYHGHTAMAKAGRWANLLHPHFLADNLIYSFAGLTSHRNKERNNPTYFTFRALVDRVTHAVGEDDADVVMPLVVGIGVRAAAGHQLAPRLLARAELLAKNPTSFTDPARTMESMVNALSYYLGHRERSHELLCQKAQELYGEDDADYAILGWGNALFIRAKKRSDALAPIVDPLLAKDVSTAIRQSQVLAKNNPGMFLPWVVKRLDGYIA